MQTQEFDEVLSQIQSWLSSTGYKKRNSTFACQKERVLLLINLQKSQKSTKEKTLITVNLGVYSQDLAAKLNEPLSTFSVWDCHWQERLGFLTPLSDDKWWELSNENPSEQVANEILESLKKYGIPAIENVSTTEKLIAFWKQGNSSGLTELQVLRYIELLEESD